MKVPEFPHVALDDVWRTKVQLDENFSGNGNDFVRPEMLANHEVVKKISIDEKIQFWRDVMQLAKDRGVDVYWFTWNVFLNGAEGKDGITSAKAAPRTIEYFAPASVKPSRPIRCSPASASLPAKACLSINSKEYPRSSGSGKPTAKASAMV